MSTGSANNVGSSGTLTLSTGNAVGGTAGGLNVELGSSQDNEDAGSSIEMTTGGSATSSGAFRVRTADAGDSGDSGDISLTTGSSERGKSGSVLIQSEASTQGGRFDPESYVNFETQC